MIIVLLIDVGCRRCMRSVVMDDETEADGINVNSTASGIAGRTCHQLPDCKAQNNRKHTAFQMCKHCAKQKYSGVVEHAENESLRNRFGCEGSDVSGCRSASSDLLGSASGI